MRKTTTQMLMKTTQMLMTTTQMRWWPPKRWWNTVVLEDYTSVQHHCEFLPQSSGRQSNHLCVWLELTLFNPVTDLKSKNPTGGEDAIHVTYGIKGLGAKARESEITGFSRLQSNIWRSKLRQMLKISRSALQTGNQTVRETPGPLGLDGNVVQDHCTSSLHPNKEAVEIHNGHDFIIVNAYVCD